MSVSILRSCFFFFFLFFKLVIGLFRSLMWSKDEWRFTDNMVSITSSAALPIVVLMIFIWLLDDNRRKQYLIISFLIASLISTIGFNIVFLNDKSREDTFCRNNAVGISYKDGVDECNIQSFIQDYAGLSSALAWCLQSIDLYLRIVHRISTQSYWLFHLGIIFLLPICSLAFMAGSQISGYNGLFPWCNVSTHQHGNGDIFSFYLPVIVILIVGFICMLEVFRKAWIVHTFGSSKASPEEAASAINAATNASENPINGMKRVNSAIRRGRSSFSLPTMQMFRVYQTPVIFVLMFLAIWITILFYRLVGLENLSTYLSSRSNWTDCVFDRSIGDVSSKDIISFCGAHQGARISFPFTCWAVFSVCGQSILISLIFFFNATIPSQVRWFLDLYCGCIVGQTKTLKHVDSLAEEMRKFPTGRPSNTVSKKPLQRQKSNRSGKEKVAAGKTFSLSRKDSWARHDPSLSKYDEVENQETASQTSTKTFDFKSYVGSQLQDDHECIGVGTYDEDDYDNDGV